MASVTQAEQQLANRKQQRSARREAILAAARQVFADRGFDGTTIADVARVAGVAAGTVYLYFPSKADLFAALHARLFEVINLALREARVGAGDMRVATRIRIRAVFEACTEQSDLLRLVFLNFDPRSDIARKMRRDDGDRTRPLAELLRAGMNVGTVREGDELLLARLITATVSVGVYQCFVQGDGARAAEYEELVTEMVIGALEPP